MNRQNMYQTNPLEQNVANNAPMAAKEMGSIPPNPVLSSNNSLPPLSAIITELEAQVNSIIIISNRVEGLSRYLGTGSIPVSSESERLKSLETNTLPGKMFVLVEAIREKTFYINELLDHVNKQIL